MQCNMQVEHNRTELKNKQKELKQGENDYGKDEKQLTAMEKELDSLQVGLLYRHESVFISFLSSLFSFL